MQSRSRLWKFILVLLLLGNLAAALAALYSAHKAHERTWTLESNLQRLLMERRDVRLAADWNIGGDVKIRLAAAPMTLHPLLSMDVPATTISDYVCESLVSYDPDTLEPRPALAAAWTESEDGLRYAFTLQDHATFSDDHPVTAEDVVFTFQTLMDNTLPRSAFLGGLKMVRALDPRTIEFTFAEASSLSFRAVANQYILPKHVYEFQTPQEMAAQQGLLVGSGPFKLGPDGYKAGMDRIELVFNPRYWNGGRSVALDQIIFRVVEEDARAFQMLKSGGLDMTDLSPEQFEEVRQDARFGGFFRLFNNYLPQGGFHFVGWNMSRAPLDDQRVRQALTLLSPRAAIIEKIFMNRARLIAAPFFHDGPQTNPALKPVPQDTARAAALLDEAGWLIDEAQGGLRMREGVPLRIELLALRGIDRRETAHGMLAEAAKAMGILLEVKLVSSEEMQQRLMRREFEGVLMKWSGAIETDP